MVLGFRCRASAVWDFGAAGGLCVNIHKVFFNV